MSTAESFESRIPVAGATRRTERQHVWILLLLATIVLFVDSNIKELHGTAVFYASLVRELVDSGDWMGIYTDDHAYLLKPPLVVWASAATSHLFGLTNFGVTFVSRIAGVGCVMLTYALIRRWWSHPVAWVAAFVMLTNSTFVQFTATLRMDSMLMFGMLMSVAGWAYRDTRWGAPALFGGITIAVLSKGPLGLGAIPLIGIHAALLGQSPVRERGWPWAILLVPVAAWYGLMLAVHGIRPFSELGVDVLRASATPDFNVWQSVYAEYVLKPLRRYWPWLPLFVVGGVICAIRVCDRRQDSAMRKHYLWAGIWLAVVFVTAVAKPDHDIRYFYLGLPVLGLFAGIAIAALSHERLARWLPGALLAVVIAASFLHHFSGGEERDTRNRIAAIRSAIAGAGHTIAIGGFPVPPHQPRRQNTHRDWIHFYTASVPEVLSWGQAKDRTSEFKDGVFLSNSRGYEQRLEEFDLIAKYVTTEMVYAVPK